MGRWEAIVKIYLFCCNFGQEKSEYFTLVPCMNSGSVCLQYFPVDQAPIEGYTVYHKPFDVSDSDYKKQTLLGQHTAPTF